jgi:hypothetical protein
VVVEFEALEEAHRHEDAGGAYYGKDEINHEATVIVQNVRLYLWRRVLP